MREAGAGSSIFALERRKGGEGGSSDGGRRRLSNGGGSNVEPCNNGSRQRSSASGSSNGGGLPASRDIEASDVGEKRKASSSDDGLLLPQWGHGKRTRCSRFEPSKHAAMAAEESAASRNPSSDKKRPSSSIAPKLRGYSEPKPSNTRDGPPPPPRNGTLSRAATNGSLRHSDGAADLPRSSPTKERVSPQRRKAADQRQQRQQKGGNEITDNPSSRMPVSHSQGHAQGNNGNTVHNHNNNNTNTNVACVSLSDQAAAAAAKLRFDINTLEWPRIVIGLSRKDKEDDFLAMKGSKLPQRPKKRSKAVEKVLHYCTPGNWLSDISRGRYEVREKKCTKKKPAGLKAMESMESDSE